MGAPGELIVINRFRVEQTQAARFRDDVQVALGTLAARPGYVGGQVGRNVDDPDLWLLSTTWANVGSYRRALTAYDVKVTAVPLLSQAVDEPSAYESVEPGGTATNEQRPRRLD